MHAHRARDSSCADTFPLRQLRSLGRSALRLRSLGRSALRLRSALGSLRLSRCRAALRLGLALLFRRYRVEVAKTLRSRPALLLPSAPSPSLNRSLPSPTLPPVLAPFTAIAAKSLRSCCPVLCVRAQLISCIC